MQAERRRLILQLNHINNRGSLTSSGEAEAEIRVASTSPGNNGLTIDFLLKEMLERDSGLGRSSWAFSEIVMEDFNTEERVSAGSCDHMICADAVLQKIQVCVPIMHTALVVKS